MTWFRAPTAQDPGRISLGYNALDRHVIGGRAAETALLRPDGRTLDFARLLEEVSALGGAFRALGVTPASRVVLALDDAVDELLAVLACTRLGAVFVVVDPAGLAEASDVHRPVLVATSSPPVFGDHVPGTCLVHGVPPVDPARDLDWGMAVRAGRGEGSAVAERRPEDPAYVVGGREISVIDAVEQDTPLGRRLAGLVAGRPVDLRTVDA